MSRFLNDDSRFNSNEPAEINFNDALKLEGGGTTCDIYRTRWQRREVFVKRLKEQYRTNPLYLDALDKEYEIGISLKHPSLPDYREFHRDYVVMDYIDGETLSRMIRNKDPWLRNEKNVTRILRELVEVTDYLHRHNVTHCDIKPDNIMITANNHNVVLIDLDKCYTDSLNDTSGDPAKYGLNSEEQGRVTIDFRGIGRVPEKMKENIPDFKFRKYNEFVKECRSKECTIDKLLEILDYIPSNSENRKFYWLVTFTPFVVALIFGIVLWVTQDKGGYKDNDGIVGTLPVNKDTVDILPEENSKATQSEEKRIDIPTPKSKKQIDLEAKEMAEQLDKRIHPYFDELNGGVDNLVSLSKEPDVTGSQLLERIRKHVDKEDEYIQETLAILNETYTGLTEREKWRVLSYSKAYTGYTRTARPILQKLGYKVEELGN